MSAATPHVECWRIYNEELKARPYGAIQRTLFRVQGYKYTNLRRLLIATEEAHSTWTPMLSKDESIDGYTCALPNGVVIEIKRNYYIRGIITDTWWHLHWPASLDLDGSQVLTDRVHQLDSLKEARTLIAQYVDNDYTIPEGACTL